MIDPPGPRRLLLAAFVLFAPAAPAADEQADEPVEAVDATVEVVGAREYDEAPAHESVSRVDRAALDREQPQDLYEALRSVPGVAIEGGPRSSGKSFSIRGFSDNEDVLIRVDGATQNFEKYRYGSGLDLDPELVRQVEVLRGAATLTQGAGALGGVVLVETLDAAELLAPGRSVGARAKLGYATNDDGRDVSLTAYGRPFEFLDLLASGVKRETNEIELPDGTRLQDSAESQLSGLFKLGFESEALRATLGHRRGDAERLEPFDATGGAASVGGTVRRATSEESTTLRLAHEARTPWLAPSLSLGYTSKNVTDLDSEMAGGPAGGTDRFDYGIWTLDLRNVSSYELGPLALRTQFGVQGNRETRQALRINALGAGFNEAQPPGEKTAWGAFVEQTAGFGDLTLIAAARLDRYAIDARGSSARLLAAQGRAKRAEFSRVTPAATISYTPRQGPLTLFYNYAEGFRPPLIDEYFTVGSLSRCQFFSEFHPRPTAPVVPAAPIAPTPAGAPGSYGSIDEYLAALTAYLAALDRYNAALAKYFTDLDAYFAALDAYFVAVAAYPDDPFAQANAICGDRYEPETSRTHELGVAFEWDGVMAADDYLRARLTWFDVRVENLLESIYENAVSGAISQPGIEVRRGFELELAYERERWFADLALSTLDGHRDLRYFDDNTNPLVALHSTPADRGPQDLIDVPANRLSFTAGYRFASPRIEIGYRFRAYDSRRVTTGFRDGCPAGFFALPACVIEGTHPGYVLHGAFASWQPATGVAFRLSADNLANRSYRLSGFGGGLGTEAPGRDVRLSVVLSY